jgi:hypothetical protein
MYGCTNADCVGFVAIAVGTVSAPRLARFAMSRWLPGVIEAVTPVTLSGRPKPGLRKFVYFAVA